MSQVRHRLRIAPAMLLIGAFGCAARGFPPNSGPLLPVFDAYSRNELVCTPTFVGNVFGFAITAPPALALLLPVAPFSGELAGRNAMMISYSGALLGGAILGTTFLPPSLLLVEDPCMTSMKSEGWRGAPSGIRMFPAGARERER